MILRWLSYLAIWAKWNIIVTIVIKNWTAISSFISDLHTKLRRISGSVSGLATDPHDDVIKWKHFPRYWPFLRGIHRSPVNSPHKGQWRGALMFSLICARINGWVNNRLAGDLRRHRTDFDVTVMSFRCLGPGINHLPPVWWSTFRFMFRNDI